MQYLIGRRDASTRPALYSDRICYFIWFLKRALCIVLRTIKGNERSWIFSITRTKCMFFWSVLLSLFLRIYCLANESFVSIFKRNMLIELKGFRRYYEIWIRILFTIFFFIYFISCISFALALFCFYTSRTLFRLKVACADALSLLGDCIACTTFNLFSFFFLGHIWYWDQTLYLVRIMCMAWLT